MENRAEVEKSAGLRHGGGVDLEPEAVLPTQFYPRILIDASLQPEKRLMLAVLEDAVGTFQKYACSRERFGQKLFEDAEAWFEENDHDWPYSFLNICNALGLEIEYMRAGLRRWKEKQRNRQLEGGAIVRFPFRRVNGSRHAITGRAVGLRSSG